MNAVKERIIDKLEHLETLSELVLQEVLDFVDYLEWKLATKEQNNHREGSIAKEYSEMQQEGDTDAFLLDLSKNFTNDLPREILENLPSDGAENHDRYLYNKLL